MERTYRFHVPNLAAGVLALPEAEAHHARSVLRVRAGQAVELFDGRGGVAAATVTAVGKREVTVTADAAQRHERPGPRLHLAFAVPKGNRLDWLLEKATELGAASLRPVVFERSVAGGEEARAAKVARWLGHCVAAAKQSGLDYLPDLLPPTPLEEWLATCGPVASGAVCLVGDVGEATPPIRAVAARLAGVADIAILVGPEGGLSETEREGVLAAGVAPVRLGATTLRVETAAVALLAAVTALT